MFFSSLSLKTNLAGNALNKISSDKACIGVRINIGTTSFNLSENGVASTLMPFICIREKIARKARYIKATKNE